MKLKARFELEKSETEKLADEILELNDMPDKAGHRRWLLTLSLESLRERLKTIREQSGNLDLETNAEAKQNRLRRGGVHAPIF